jgi:dTDP-4-dehydrorhamnose reductase
MKIAVIGADGQLGTDVVYAFVARGDTVYKLTHSLIEIADLNSVSGALEKIEPHLIINTAAMHHVEDCETNPVKAFAVNSLGAKNLAVTAHALSSVLMHISTDYVFNGDKRCPYTEDDNPQPKNAYGITKLAGEHFIRSNTEKHFIVRTSGLYGKSPCRAKGGPNFVELMLKLARERGEVRVVNNEMVSPTSTAELAEQLVHLSRVDRYGIYHATAEGSCTWYDFAQEIFRLSKISVTLQVARRGEYPAKVRRPEYSVLENQGLKKLDINIFKTWQEGLRVYLNTQINENSATGISR